MLKIARRVLFQLVLHHIQPVEAAQPVLGGVGDGLAGGVAAAGADAVGLGDGRGRVDVVVVVARLGGEAGGAADGEGGDVGWGGS